MPDNILRVLYFGDIVGRPGRQALQRALESLRATHSPDLVVANVENLAHGFGITPATIQELESYGVDAFTSGNHIFDNESGVAFLRTNPTHVVRPANYHPSTPGVPYTLLTKKGVPVLIINLLGQTFMPDEVASPFTTFDSVLETVGTEAIVIVDLHAEATGEKYAFGHYIDGRAALLVGTHTHIPTADEQIFARGLGYITDIGFSGAKHSSLGMDIERVVQKVAFNQPIHLEPPREVDVLIARAIIADIDIASKSTISIERVDQTYTV